MAQHSTIKRRQWKKARQYILTIFNSAARELMSANELFKTLQKNRLQLEKLMQYLEMLAFSSFFFLFLC